MSEFQVTILPSPDDHELGSSKLKISNIVNYGWDHRYHAGQLVAVHKAGTFFAYGILTPGQSAIDVMHRLHVHKTRLYDWVISRSIIGFLLKRHLKPSLTQIRLLFPFDSFPD